jgi:putative transcriptional regulator
MLICRLGEILKERGIKKGWLADQVGVSNNTVGDWINKGRVPELEVAYRVAEVLDLNVMEIWVKK